MIIRACGYRANFCYPHKTAAELVEKPWLRSLTTVEMTLTAARSSLKVLPVVKIMLGARKGVRKMNGSVAEWLQSSSEYKHEIRDGG